MKNIFDKYSELISARAAVFKLENEILDEFKIWVESNRAFAKGEKVMVYEKGGGNRLDSPIGIGIIGGGYKLLDLSFPERVKDFANFVSDEGTIYYEVMAMKADQTASAKHFFGRPHTMPASKHKYSDYFIEKIEVQ